MNLEFQFGSLTDTVASLDLLTGALARGLFEQKLAGAVSEARQKGRTLAVLVLDVDDLLELNDRFGDAAADAAISDLAERICEEVDGKGPLGRLTGGTFSVFLPGVPLKEAKAIAERIRQSCARASFGEAGETFSITVSIGVTQLRPNEPWGNLLESAETACRMAKIGGRNQVAVR